MPWIISSLIIIKHKKSSKITLAHPKISMSGLEDWEWKILIILDRYGRALKTNCMLEFIKN